MWRAFGWRPALAVLVLDAAKGWLPAFLVSGLPAGDSAAAASTLGLSAGAGAVLVGLGVFSALLGLTRHVSAAAVAAAAAMPVTLLAFRRGFGYSAPPADVCLAAALAGLIVFTHRSNLSRLLRGVEPRVGAAEGGVGGRRPRADETTTGGRT